MALMLWKRGENVLARALLARKLYLDMKNRLEKEFSSTNEVLVERLEKNAKWIFCLFFLIDIECITFNTFLNKFDSHLQISYWYNVLKRISKILLMRCLNCKNINNNRNCFYICSDFGKLALGVLDECYKVETRSTLELLQRPVYKRSEFTCWQLATSSNFEEFIAHPVCQSVVSKSWNGHILHQGRLHSYLVRSCILNLSKSQLILFMSFHFNFMIDFIKILFSVL